MEYSLNSLNQNANLKLLTISQIIDQLNLIGFEVDDTFEESSITNEFIDNFRLLIKIPANREDLLTEQFLLSELSSIFSFKLKRTWKQIRKQYYSILKEKHKEFSRYDKQTIENISSKIKHEDLQIFSFELSPNKEFTTPLWIQSKLLNAGKQVKNNLCDILELNNLEWGQTLNCLSSNLKKYDLILDQLRKPEQYISSEKKIYNLTQGTVVIRNSENEILIVLGLFNQMDTKSLKKSTSNVIIQSIFYDIHKNSLLLNPLENKISLRYLRSFSLRNFRASFERVLTIIELTKVGTITPNISSTRNTKDFILPYRRLDLRKSLIKDTLGIEKINLNIFKKAGFFLISETAEKLCFIIPKQRNDLLREIDLVEEYSRFIGYENFIPLKPQRVNKYFPTKTKNIALLKQLFLSKGFQEVVTNPFRDISIKNSNSITLRNPLNNELSSLRQNLLEKIIDIFETNLRLQTHTGKYFEIGRVFTKNEHGEFHEQENISGIFQVGQTKKTKEPNFEWFVAKGFIEHIFFQFGYKNIRFVTLTATNSQQTSLYHPTKSTCIIHGGKCLGIFGEVNPNLSNFKNLKFSTYIFELPLENFSLKRMISSVPVVLKEFSKTPTITKDLSFLIDKNTNFYEMKTKIRNSLPFLKHIEFFDIYFDKTINNKVNVGMRIKLQSDLKAFTSQKIDEEIHKIKEILVEKFYAEIKS